MTSFRGLAIWAKMMSLGVTKVTWKSLGSHLEVTWKSLGNHLEVTWKSLGSHLEVTWKSLGSHLEVTWKSLGSNLESLGVTEQHQRATRPKK
jgi:hypothetical protein